MTIISLVSIVDEESCLTSYSSAFLSNILNKLWDILDFRSPTKLLLSTDVFIMDIIIYHRLLQKMYSYYYYYNYLGAKHIVQGNLL